MTRTRTIYLGHSEAPDDVARRQKYWGGLAERLPSGPQGGGWYIKISGSQILPPSGASATVEGTQTAIEPPVPAETAQEASSGFIGPPLPEGDTLVHPDAIATPDDAELSVQSADTPSTIVEMPPLNDQVDDGTGGAGGSMSTYRRPTFLGLYEDTGKDNPSAFVLSSGGGFVNDVVDLGLARALWGLGLGHNQNDALVIFSHGLATGSLNTADINGGNADEVAEWIRSQPTYTAGMPIQLNACFAGIEGGLAQNLSKRLAGPISGPTDRVDQWGNVDTDERPWNEYQDGRLVDH